MTIMLQTKMNSTDEIVVTRVNASTNDSDEARSSAVLRTRTVMTRPQRGTPFLLSRPKTFGAMRL